MFARTESLVRFADATRRLQRQEEREDKVDEEEELWEEVEKLKRRISYPNVEPFKSYRSSSSKLQYQCMCN